MKYPSDSSQTQEFARNSAETLPQTHTRFADGTVTPEGGQQIGRYEIISEIGAGAMGVVYRALDPELRREVAVKIHKFSGQASDAVKFRKRLFREGQALARVSDPNVVTVYDVGLFRGQVFVAMELVRGRTLRDWVSEEKRSADAIIDRYLGLASGLAAAHRAGLVHRDVKPANAIVGDDGRVRVVDFGLACGDIAVNCDTASVTREIAKQKRITENGLVLGTPDYIAPEQLAGERVSERTDQFSFCVALWEALAGTLPFSSSSLEARASAIAARAYQGQEKLPRSIRQILIRGLSPSPAHRHDSMDSLATKLRRVRSRQARRSRILLLAMVCLSCLYGIVRLTMSVAGDKPVDGLHEKADPNALGPQEIADEIYLQRSP